MCVYFKKQRENNYIGGLCQFVTGWCIVSIIINKKCEHRMCFCCFWRSDVRFDVESKNVGLVFFLISPQGWPELVPQGTGSVLSNFLP